MVFSGPENCIHRHIPPKSPVSSPFLSLPPFSTTTPPPFSPHQTKNHQNRIVAESNASQKAHHSAAGIQSICLLRSNWRETAHASAFSSLKGVGCGVLGAGRNPRAADCYREAIRTSRSLLPHGPGARNFQPCSTQLCAPSRSRRFRALNWPPDLLGRSLARTLQAIDSRLSHLCEPRSVEVSTANRHIGRLAQPSTPDDNTIHCSNGHFLLNIFFCTFLPTVFLR